MNPDIFEPLTHGADHLPFLLGGAGLASVGLGYLFLSIINRMTSDEKNALRNTLLGGLLAFVGIGVLGGLIFVKSQEATQVQANLQPAIAKTYGLHLTGTQVGNLVEGDRDDVNYKNPDNGTRYGKTNTVLDERPATVFLYYANGQYRLASSIKLQELPRR